MNFKEGQGPAVFIIFVFILVSRFPQNLGVVGIGPDGGVIQHVIHHLSGLLPGNRVAEGHIIQSVIERGSTDLKGQAVGQNVSFLSAYFGKTELEEVPSQPGK